MIDPIALPERELTIRELAPPDEAGVLRLMAASEDFFVSAAGLPAAPADVQSLYYSLPEGARWEDKLLLVAVRGDRVVAVVDAVRRYPGPLDCAVGLFMVHPAERRRGIGTAIADALLGRARAAGLAAVTATVPSDWTPGERFLLAAGFAIEPSSEARAASATVGNRSAGPRERPARRAVLRLAQR